MSLFLDKKEIYFEPCSEHEEVPLRENCCFRRCQTCQNFFKVKEYWDGSILKYIPPKIEQNSEDYIKKLVIKRGRELYLRSSFESISLKRFLIKKNNEIIV